jgi:hypothetical protein
MNWTLIIGIVTGIIIPVLWYHLHGYDKTKENLYSKIREQEKESLDFRFKANRKISDLNNHFNKKLADLEIDIAKEYIKGDDVKILIKDLKVEIKENRKEFMVAFGKLSEELRDHAKENKVT